MGTKTGGLHTTYVECNLAAHALRTAMPVYCDTMVVGGPKVLTVPVVKSLLLLLLPVLPLACCI